MASNSDVIVKLCDLVEILDKKLKAYEADIERLTLDVKILSEELEIARRPRQDER